MASRLSSAVLLVVSFGRVTCVVRTAIGVCSVQSQSDLKRTPVKGKISIDTKIHVMFHKMLRAG